MPSSVKPNLLDDGVVDTLGSVGATSERRIVDYPALWRFTRDIYNLQGGGRDREPAAHPPSLLRKPYEHKSERHLSIAADELSKIGA
jgi:hypothetical protein